MGDRRSGVEGRVLTERTDQRRAINRLDAELLGRRSSGAGWIAEVERVPHHQRPMLTAVRAIGGVKVMAVGAYGEASTAVGSLMSALAAGQAKEEWERRGFESRAVAAQVSSAPRGTHGPDGTAERAPRPAEQGAGRRIYGFAEPRSRNRGARSRHHLIKYIRPPVIDCVIVGDWPLSKGGPAL